MTPSELAHDLSTLVATVDGVTGLYDARPPVLAALSGAVGSIGRIAPVGRMMAGRMTPGDPVLVEEHSNRITVTVAISVTDVEPASATSRRVYERLEAWLAEHPESPVVDAIAVRIGHVGGPAPSPPTTHP